MRSPGCLGITLANYTTPRLPVIGSGRGPGLGSCRPGLLGTRRRDPPACMMPDKWAQDLPARRARGMDPKRPARRLGRAHEPCHRRQSPRDGVPPNFPLARYAAAFTGLQDPRFNRILAEAYLANGKFGDAARHAEAAIADGGRVGLWPSHRCYLLREGGQPRACRRSPR